jgi:membrane-bound serine protease (ClpP class)
LRESVEARAECVVIELDTPGGLVDPTRAIVIDILSSEIPVVVYVSPAGGRATSAGMFIVLASHIAAMAPGTHIGAAHPVLLPALSESPQKGSPPTDKDSDDDSPTPGSVMEIKSVNDTKAWARSLAELRGRNADWAALAVTDSDAIVAHEAMEQGVVEIIAADLEDLLSQIDGRTVELPQGSVRIATARARVRTVEMWWGESFLSTLSNPNVAFLLLMLGFYGILFEFYTPGWGISGTLGIVCLVLSFFALAVLPVSYAGLALIVLALGLFVAEAFVTSFGALTLGGCLCLILGGLMLVESPAGFMRVSWSVVLPIAVATALITVFLVSRIVRVHRSRVQTGSESLRGTRVIVKDGFDADKGRYRGMIFVHGEYWQAVSSQPVSAGARVEIRELQGLTMHVEPVCSAEDTGSG